MAAIPVSAAAAAAACVVVPVRRGGGSDAVRLLGFATAVVAMTLCPVGCSHTPHAGVPTASVKISITNVGSPLAGADVEFCSVRTGMGAGGTLDGRGCLALDGVPLGDYTVTVTPQGNASPDAPVAAAPTPQKAPTIPARFSHPLKSPLRVTVAKGKNDFVLELNDVR